MKNLKDVYLKLKATVLSLPAKARETIAVLHRYPYREKQQKLCAELPKIGQRIRTLPALLWKKIRKFRLRKTAVYRYGKKIGKTLSDSWKAILLTVPSFLLFYYFIGSNVVENMDVTTEYKLPAEKTVKSELLNSMAFLIQREIDEKMWTPNLPIFFPAYVLDNMPNFQIGVMSAVRDNAAVVRNFRYNSEKQQKEAKKAYAYLRYAPNVWLLSRAKGMSIAPSSNVQYRKARKELLHFNGDSEFLPTDDDLTALLRKISGNLQKITRKSEDYQQEHCSDLFDTKADDLFYYNRGYAFAQWQMLKAAGTDFKKIILDKDAYTEWTFLLSSLKKTAEFKPLTVRNACSDSSFAPNHLLVQNYYLLRALTAAQQVELFLQTEKNAD
jgi:hypothetical protein